MISESSLGTSLEKINWGVGIENETFMENAPKNTSYNSDAQKISRQAMMDVRTTELYSPWQNNAKRITRIINVKSKIIRVQ